MKMRWVVTFKDDGSLKARVVVQGFTDQRLGKIPDNFRIESARPVSDTFCQPSYLESCNWSISVFDC